MSVEVTETGLNLIPAGYKQTEVGVIPEDWKCYSFGDLVDYKKGYAFKSDEYGKTGIRIIRVSDTSYSGIKDDSPIFISDKLAKLYHAWSIKEGDLIFSTVGSKPPMYDSLVGKAIYVTKKYEGSLLNQNAVRIRAKSKTEGIQSLLLNHFRTERYIDFIELIFRGNANQASITLENLFEFKIPLPRLEKEQTAIANALSDVDALISELEKLIGKKQAIKTATMQQLLTGRTRLPQFALREDDSKKGTKQSELGEIPEDWEVDSIENLISITTGSRNTQDRIEEGVYPFFVRSQTVERINTFSFDGEAVLTAGDGVGTGKIFHYINGKFDFHQRVYLMYNFGEIIDGYFFYIYFSNNFYDRIMSMTAKSSVDSVRREMIADMKMLLPTKKEQTAIATILSDMDEEIQVLEQRLSKTRQIKQGMMQELLTGKTRLVQPSLTDICHVD
ncbi:restriction endonuclease subunit S [Proteus mirabilis]|uniref:restriction endonuclease subunit S n=1 Tax=Proteus mirabilis TaxID=584 RepID=UPI001A1DA7F1|nr:restriction endonuclease subunit S [Proteus mirabilis]MDF7290620.1 restriction endonuclease subunit S [Proteus mirabilis]HAU5560097.1 restriction endonuclease subunit S [Proteus mirabilis]